jgi:cysteinyl-tRNA synthetase
VVRFFILTAHYRSPIDFSDQNLQESKTGLCRFYEALQAADEALSGVPESEAASTGGAAMEEKFREAMDDDFNSALAIGHLFEGVRTLNRLMGEKKFRKKPDLVAAVRDLRRTIQDLGGVLGLFGSEPAAWLEQQKLAALAELDITAEQIEQLIAARRQARQEKDFARADALRQELDAKGIELLDTPQGTSWKVK